MLSYNQLKPGTYIVFNKDPYEILEYDFLRMQQRKPVAQVKMRNLVTGNSMSYTFHQSDKIEEADMSYKTIKFLYSNKDEYWFCTENDPKNRFTFSKGQLGKKADFLKNNVIVDAIIFNKKIIDIKIPIKVELKVIEAPPGIRGDTAQGGTKQIKLESGASINAPLFINQDDIVRVNTQTGQYIERAEKA
jgi:elongation factor P